METRHFQKAVLRMKLFLSLQSFTCHIVNICFYQCRYQNQNFSLVSHSCRSCSTRVSLVSHSCRQCRTRVARVALVSLVSGTRVANQTRSNFLCLSDFVIMISRKRIVRLSLSFTSRYNSFEIREAFFTCHTL